MDKFDVLVVGAGTAGCLAAKTAAEKGLQVCIIESKKREDIGVKVCGDALGEHHLNALGLEKPQGGELEKKIEGVQIYSPDQNTVFTIADKDFIGYILNRRLFGQWLLKKATDEGASLIDSTQFLKPIIEKGFVTGAKVKNPMNTTEIKSKVTVDASGFMGVVRHKLPLEMQIDREIENEDVEACYREIRQLKQENENTKYCEIYLSGNITPGGYTWIFPKGGAKVNVGLGVVMRGEYPNPKKQLYDHILPRQQFEGSLLLNAGAWWDPTRRPLDNMVGNGVILVGDAASLVNPIHGGGIGPSMLSGAEAGKTIAEALEKAEPSQDALWNYNLAYMSAYGNKQASLDIFRLLLIGSSDEDLNYGMNCKLITEEDVLKAAMGDNFHINITETAKRIFRGRKRMGFLRNLSATVKMMREVRQHYDRYPTSPKGFQAWREQTVKLVEQGKQRLLD
ncbi:MAG TPA: NAD(P)/FAD-dependent oxidoreductase [Candidatus Sulfotelmatobacter sp.]|nr:NAD(P)/FAD-dependent oxidoreductase [Candidatus Sulfotelmatobacter sp.]